MENIFYSIIEADCQEISSSFNDNGLFEFTIPKNCTNEEISKYFHDLGEEERSKIVDKQKKTKKVFRKKVKEMIDKYEKEFNLDLCINLRLPNKTKKLNDCNVQILGMVFEGNLSIVSSLQYFPDELVEKIVRCTIYMLACKYEECHSRIKSMSVCEFDLLNCETTSRTTYKVPEDAKYHISVSDSEIEKIKTDYKTACDQIMGALNKRPINYI